MGCTRKPPDGLFGLRVPQGTCGLLTSGAEARLVLDDGTDAGIGEVGELWVKGPFVALGYYGNEQETKEAFVDGWLRTGDFLRTDRDGFLLYVLIFKRVVPKY